MDYRIQKHENPSYDLNVLKRAFSSPLCAYIPYTEVNKPSELEGSTALLYLLLIERHHPGLVVDGCGSVKDRILANIRNLLIPGHEPSLKVGPIWAPPMTSGSLCLAKITPSIWDELTDAEKNRIDWIMKAFVVTCSWGSATQNDYKTGPCLKGNYSKYWNPNIRSPHVLPILFATKYFGSSEAVDDILLNFSYDEYMQTFADMYFTNFLRTWSPAGKKLFEEGGNCYLQNNGETPIPAGSGKGVKFPYSYFDVPLKETVKIFNTILEQNTNGGKVVNAVGKKGAPDYAYLLDGSSPVLGLDGMMSEFVSHDALGIRSDVNYCSANFCILSPSLACAIELGLWDPDDPQNERTSRLTCVSDVDFLYKFQHGYHSYSKGHGHDHYETSGHGGYLFSKDIWNNYLCPLE